MTLYETVLYDEPSTLRGQIGRRSNLDGKNPHDETPLYFAASYGRIECLELLASGGATVDRANYQGRTPLHMAHANTECIDILLHYGADVRARDMDGRTPLHLACAYGNKKGVRSLVRHGADMSCRDKFGATPLHMAYASAKCIGVLLRRGANVRARDKKGQTALHWVCAHGNMEGIRSLLAYEADIDIPDKKGITPFDLVPEEMKEMIERIWVEFL